MEVEMKLHKKIILNALLLTVLAILMANLLSITVMAAKLPSKAPAWFDGEYYATNNTDVAAIYGTKANIKKYGNLDEAMYAHYKKYGADEGRAAAESEDWFDEKYYADNNPDVVAAYGDAKEGLLKHYRTYGRKEGRLPKANYVHTYVEVSDTKKDTKNAKTNPTDNKVVQAQADANAAINTTAKEGKPYYVMVNRAANTITIYSVGDDGKYSNPYKALLCSTGREGHRTPLGNYTIYEHTAGGGFVSMVDGTYGKYCMRFRKGGLMFHTVCYSSTKDENPIQDEVDLLGDYASLGCVRLSVADAEWLFNNMPNGTPVTIYDDADNPGPLGKPSK